MLASQVLKLNIYLHVFLSLHYIKRVHIRKCVFIIDESIQKLEQYGWNSDYAWRYVHISLFSKRLKE